MTNGLLFLVCQFVLVATFTDIVQLMCKIGDLYKTDISVLFRNDPVEIK